MHSLVERHCIEWNNRTLFPNDPVATAATTPLPIYASELPSPKLPKPNKTLSNACHLTAGLYLNEVCDIRKFILHNFLYVCLFKFMFLYDLYIKCTFNIYCNYLFSDSF